MHFDFMQITVAGFSAGGQMYNVYSWSTALGYNTDTASTGSTSSSTSTKATEEIHSTKLIFYESIAANKKYSMSQWTKNNANIRWIIG